MGALVFHNVTKRFEEVTAVQDVTLDVANGEFVVLVGPSGCGKTTLLRLVAGLELLTEGEILMDGRRLNDLTPRERDVAMVFQDYALYPHMTVFENMAFGLKARRLPKAEIRQRVADVARTLGLQGLLKRRPGALSGGQRQRVAMGRAIVRQPQAFLFDEPLSNLDAKLRVQMRAEIRRLCDRLRTTVLYVTHDQVEAMTMADRIVILNEGRVQQIGTPSEVYDEPTNRFVAGFIGSPPMNFLHGEIRCVGGRWEWVAAECRVTLAPAVGERAGVGQVWLGFRPEAVTPEPARATGFTINGNVVASELLGRERILVIETAAGTMNAVVPPDTTPRGQVKVSVAPENVHVFHE